MQTEDSCYHLWLMTHQLSDGLCKFEGGKATHAPLPRVGQETLVAVLQQGAQGVGGGRQALS